MSNYYRYNSANRIISNKPNNIVRPVNNFNNINSRQIYNDNFNQNFSNGNDITKRNYSKDNRYDANRLNEQYNINRNMNYKYNSNNYPYNNNGLGNPNIKKENDANYLKAYENKKKNAEELYSKGNNYHMIDTNKANEDYHKRAIRGISHPEKKNNYFEGKDYRINNNPNYNYQKNDGRSRDIINYDKIGHNSDKDKFISNKEVENIKNSQQLEESKSKHTRPQSHGNNNNYIQNRQNRQEFINQKDKLNYNMNDDLGNIINQKKRTFP